MTDLNGPMQDFDALVESLRPISEMLSGVARSLAKENGWSEPQARELVVAVFVNSVRNQT